MMNNQPYHLVSQSPWPILTFLSILNNLICMAAWFNKINNISRTIKFLAQSFV